MSTISCLGIISIAHNSIAIAVSGVSISLENGKFDFGKTTASLMSGAEKNVQDRQLIHIAQIISPQVKADYESGTKKYNIRDYKGALADFDRAINNLVPSNQPDSDVALIYLARGATKKELRNYQESLADYNRAIQLKPNLAIAYVGRGILQADKLHNTQGSLADFDRAIQLDPKLIIAYDSRGVLKMDILHDYQGALADYNRAIQLDPNYANTYGNRGELKYLHLKDRAGGISDMQRSAELYQQRGDSKRYQDTSEQLKKWKQTGKNPNRFKN